MQNHVHNTLARALRTHIVVTHAATAPNGVITEGSASDYEGLGV